MSEVVEDEEEKEETVDSSGLSAIDDSTTPKEGNESNNKSPSKQLLEMEPQLEEKVDPLQQEIETKPKVPVASPAREPTGKGAQILMNRFQSLKDRANQNAQNLLLNPTISTNAKAVQERAGNFWKTAAPKMETLRSTLKKMETAPSTNENKKSTTLGEKQTTAPDIAATSLGNKSADKSTNANARVMPKEVRANEFSLQDGNQENSQSENEDSGVNMDMDININTEMELDDTDHDSSVGGASDAATRILVGRAFTKASLAATVAYESVLSTGFRGRYNASNVEGDKSEESVTDTRPMPESQVDIILKSRVGQHMQEILDKLEPYEYAMLLGRGMLGVNLKQCYLKNHGVFVDFLVPGGQAESSGVVRSGDLPIRLGDSDLRKGTILDIPIEISKSRRPVILTFATGSKVALERMNFIDVAVAMMHRARDYYTKRGTLSNLPSASPTRGATEGDTMVIKSVSDVTVPPADTIDSFLTPPAPTLDIRREFVDEVPLR